MLTVQSYLQELATAVEKALFRDNLARSLAPEEAYRTIIQNFRRMRIVSSPRHRNKLIFIGNGGSAAIASHMAEDYSKMARVRAICFNDAPLLTCLANDYSFPEVFEKALELYADSGDIVVAISSSGKSANIINAATFAKKLGCGLITLSGFNSENPLSRLGDINIFTPAAYPKYGIVENAHQIILHYILDRMCAESST